MMPQPTDAHALIDGQLDAEGIPYALSRTAFAVSVTIERVKQEAAVLSGSPTGDAVHEGSRDAEVTSAVTELATQLGLTLSRSPHYRYRLRGTPRITTAAEADPENFLLAVNPGERDVAQLSRLTRLGVITPVRASTPGRSAPATTLRSVLPVPKTLVGASDHVAPIEASPTGPWPPDRRYEVAVDASRSIQAVRTERADRHQPEEDAQLAEIEAKLSRLFTGGVTVEEWTGEFVLRPPVRRLTRAYRQPLVAWPHEDESRLPWMSDSVGKPPPDSWVAAVSGIPPEASGAGLSFTLRVRGLDAGVLSAGSRGRCIVYRVPAQGEAEVVHGRAIVARETVSVSQLGKAVLLSPSIGAGRGARRD